MNRDSLGMGRRSAFTLVELLVVMGIIALLIAILLPSLTAAREQSKRVTCQHNLHIIGEELLIYSNSWRGWMYPPRLGASKNPWDRWPVHVFKFGNLPTPPVNDTAIYTPKVMLCPSDDQPANEHSYILNDHLADRNVRYFSKALAGLTPSDLVLMGEKRSQWPDYYMNKGDFASRVEPYRHGALHGSNYLFLDIHVGLFKPRDPNSNDPNNLAPLGLDPWDVPVTDKGDQ